MDLRKNDGTKDVFCEFSFELWLVLNAANIRYSEIKIVCIHDKNPSAYV